jgi:hypothetical protein
MIIPFSLFLYQYFLLNSGAPGTGLLYNIILANPGILSRLPVVIFTSNLLLDRLIVCLFKVIRV